MWRVVALDTVAIFIYSKISDKLCTQQVNLLVIIIFHEYKFVKFV